MAWEGLAPWFAHRNNQMEEIMRIIVIVFLGLMAFGQEPTGTIVPDIDPWVAIWPQPLLPGSGFGGGGSSQCTVSISCLDGANISCVSGDGRCTYKAGSCHRCPGGLPWTKCHTAGWINCSGDVTRCNGNDDNCVPRKNDSG